MFTSVLNLLSVKFLNTNCNRSLKNDAIQKTPITFSIEILRWIWWCHWKSEIPSYLMIPIFFLTISIEKVRDDFLFFMRLFFLPHVWILLRNLLDWQYSCDVASIWQRLIRSIKEYHSFLILFGALQRSDRDSGWR